MQELGIEDAFSPQVTGDFIFCRKTFQADFSGLNGAKDLRLGSFLQINTFSNKKGQVPKRFVIKLKVTSEPISGERKETGVGRKEGEGGKGDELPPTKEPANENIQTPF